MFNSDNMVPKKVSSEGIPVHNPANVKKNPPNTRKEFKDVLQGKDDSLVDDDVEADKLKRQTLAKAKQSRTKSIFDLSAHTDDLALEDHPMPTSAASDPAQLAADLALAGQVNAKFADKPEFAQEVSDLTSIVPNLAALQQTPVQTPKGPQKDEQLTPNAAISQQTPRDSKGSESNLAAMTPPVVPFVIDRTAAPVTEPAKVSPPIQEIINQLVDKIYTLQTSGRTDTVVVFKNPPILDGMQLTLSAFDTAKKEFNITFSNLTQAGQTLLEKNLGFLKAELDRLGVVTHMVVLTTQNDSITASGADEKNFRDQRDDEGTSKEQKKKR